MLKKSPGEGEPKTFGPRGGKIEGGKDFFQFRQGGGPDPG